MASTPHPQPAVPRNPVPGPHNWQAVGEGPTLPCLLDAPGMQFTTSGRGAILLGLEALALSPADRVLVPSYHCPTMVSPAVALNQPFGFYPLSADGLPQLDWLDRHAPADTRVVCATHLFGLPLDLRPLRAWCDQHGVLLLEDCAHAMFGHGPAGAVGALGDLVIASLPKFFAVQEGGLLRVRQPGRPVRALPPAGLKAELQALLDCAQISDRHGRLGSWRLWARPLLTAKQSLRRQAGPAPAAAPSAAPETFDPNSDYARVDVARSHRAPTRLTVRTAQQSARGRIIAQRRRHYTALAEALSARPGLHPLFPALPDQAAPYVFPLWVDEPDPAYRKLRDAGVPVSRWDWLWPGVPDLPGDVGKPWAHHVLQLHCHQDMTDADRDWMARTVLHLCAR